MTTKLIRVCGANVAELTGVSVGGIEVVVVPGREGPRVFEGRCPHQGTLLSEGQLEGDVLICRAHGWRFDTASGGKRCDAQGPGLTAMPTVAKPDGLYIDLGQRSDQAAAARRTFVDLPGPTGWPVVGNSLQVKVSQLHSQLEGWADVFGDVYSVRIGPRRGVVISEPAMIEQLFRARPTTFRRITDIALIAAEIGADGVFTAEGDSWRRQRKLATESLSQRHFERFFPSLTLSTTRLRNRWLKAKGAPSDVLADFTRLTVDVTTGLAFGLEMNTLEKDDEVIQQHLKHIFPALGRRLAAPFPYWRYVKLPADRQLDRSLEQIYRILRELVGKARARVEALPETQRTPADFLEAMILARDDAGQPFSDEIIFGNTLTMLLAGEDTTASSLAWAIHELCERPDLVEAARDEIAGAVNSDGVVQSLAMANAMPFLDAIAYEALRFRAVAPFLLFEANEDTTLGEVAIPKGAPVYVLIRRAGMRSSQFADAAAFRPQRWLEKQYPHTGGGYTPFGAGPRLCPGRSLALLEMRVVLAMALHTFDLQREGTKDEVAEHWAFTLFAKNLRVRMVPRRAQPTLSATPEPR
jgi:cytochrome P450/nitrite reductase/ring-hydroxylating ferredoxin subunit